MAPGLFSASLTIKIIFKAGVVLIRLLVGKMILGYYGSSSKSSLASFM